jgi:hypothetical protein
MRRHPLVLQRWQITRLLLAAFLMAAIAVLAGAGSPNRVPTHQASPGHPAARPAQATYSALR